MSAISPVYLSGYGGSITIDAVSVPIQNWDLSLNADSFDATNSASAGYRNVERAIVSADGSFDAVWKVSSGAPTFSVGAKYACTFLTQSGQVYSFNALVNSVDIKTDVKGGVTYSCKVMSDGAIVVPTS